MEGRGLDSLAESSRASRERQSLRVIWKVSAVEQANAPDRDKRSLYHQSSVAAGDWRR